jgi:hypothetical protein
MPVRIENALSDMWQRSFRSSYRAGFVRSTNQMVGRGFIPGIYADKRKRAFRPCCLLLLAKSLNANKGRLQKVRLSLLLL